MKYLKHYKLFESIDISTIEDTFNDVEFDDMELKITTGYSYDGKGGIIVTISKFNDDNYISEKEYSKIHNIIISKISYLEESGFKCLDINYEIDETDISIKRKVRNKAKITDINFKDINNYLFHKTLLPSAMWGINIFFK